MTYFVDSEDAATELAAAFSYFLSAPAGAQAAALASEGFDLGKGLPNEATLLLVTSEPTTRTVVVLGTSPSAVNVGEDVAAHVRLDADCDTLHDVLLENYDAGQIARAVEERRLILSGPPWSKDALIVLAGAFGSTYRASLEGRGRADLLNTPAPVPAGTWVVDVPSADEFVGVVLAGRRKFAQTTSR